MEALAALSLAANIIQVVGFSHHIFSAIYETYKIRSFSDNAELEQIALDLKAANDSLQQDSCGKGLSKHDQVSRMSYPTYTGT